MKHDLQQEGIAYRLRPVVFEDASLIIDLRLEDADRNKYIHKISADVSQQETWLERYFHREGDLYFVVENRLTNEPEGLIGIYDIDGGKAEWGRWVIKRGSMASAESLDLVFKLAFQTLELEELYCRTITENTSVVSLHDGLPQLRRGVLKNSLDVNGQSYDAVEHYVTPEHYHSVVAPALEKKAMLVFQRNLRSLIGPLEFHHIGIATSDIEKEYQAYRFLGYLREDASFVDPEQGIKGQFITATGQPRLELLENLASSNTLDVWLKNRVKMYHFAYLTEEFDKALEVLNRNRIRSVGPPKMSVYFKKRICFLMLSPGFLIELIEK